MMSERIVIAVAANQRYYPGAFVTCASIAMHATKDVELAFCVLDSGIEDASFSELEQLVTESHPHVSFRRVKLDDKMFVGFPSWRGNHTTFLRFALPTVLKDEEFVVYVDSDVMWRADIADFWKLRDRNVIVRGVADLYARRKEREWFPRHGLVFREDKYFNAGNVIFNLAKMRRGRTIERATNFIGENPDILNVDQSALNGSLSPDEIALVPPQWNVFSGLLTIDDLKHPVVIHYANEIPWIRNGLNAAITDTILLWHQCNAQARKISVFKSLRMYFPLRKIIFARGLFLIAVWPLTRWAFYGMVNVFGSANLAHRCHDWYRRLSWPGQSL